MGEVSKIGNEYVDVREVISLLDTHRKLALQLVATTRERVCGAFTLDTIKYIIAFHTPFPFAT